MLVNARGTAARREPGSGTKLVYFAGGDVFGGVEQMILTTLERIDTRRWEVVLMHYADAEIGPLLCGARAAGIRTLAVARSRGSAALRIMEIVRALRAERPVIFHAHLPLPQYCRTPILAAAFAGVPAVVATAHLFQPLSNRRQATYQRILNRVIDRYIAVSNATAAELVGALGVPKRKVTVIPNGVPVEKFACTRGMRVACNRESSGTVFTSARLHPQKGLGDLVEAARLLPGVEFLIAGDGPLRAELAAKVQGLGLAARVRLLGHRSDVPALLQSCDVFALPSLFEGLPLAVLEAMAAARPIVACDIAGVREAISDGETGLLVRPGHPDELARAIRTLLSDPPLSRRLGRQAGERARREFSAKLMVERTCHLYDELTSN
jgi:glycosyltransferase involved in cell wall biosynthesis